jgi:hypothetical protein
VVNGRVLTEHPRAPKSASQTRMNTGALPGSFGHLVSGDGLEVPLHPTAAGPAPIAPSSWKNSATRRRYR